MFPYQFDPVQPEKSASPPAPPPKRGRLRRVGLTILLVLALTLSALGGGAVGAVAALHWLVPQQAMSPVIAAQPVAAQHAPTSSVAGAVFSAVGPAVVRVTVAGQARGGLT